MVRFDGFFDAYKAGMTFEDPKEGFTKLAEKTPVITEGGKNSISIHSWYLGQFLKIHETPKINKIDDLSKNILLHSKSKPQILDTDLCDCDMLKEGHMLASPDKETYLSLLRVLSELYGASIMASSGMKAMGWKRIPKRMGELFALEERSELITKLFNDDFNAAWRDYSEVFQGIAEIEGIGDKEKINLPREIYSKLKTVIQEGIYQIEPSPDLKQGEWLKTFELDYKPSPVNENSKVHLVELPEELQRIHNLGFEAGENNKLLYNGPISRDLINIIDEHEHYFSVNISNESDCIEYLKLFKNSSTKPNKHLILT